MRRLLPILLLVGCTKTDDSAELARLRAEVEALKKAPAAVPPVEEEKCPLTLVGLDLKTRPRGASSVLKELVVTLTMRNDGQRRVRAWKARVAFADVFGAPLLTENFQDGSASVAPTKGVAVSFAFPSNPYVGGQPFDKLTGYSSENVKATLVECIAAYSDEKTPAAAKKSGGKRKTDLGFEALDEPDRVFIPRKKDDPNALTLD